jgi:hypothetical protein
MRPSVEERIVVVLTRGGWGGKEGGGRERGRRWGSASTLARSELFSPLREGVPIPLCSTEAADNAASDLYSASLKLGRKEGGGRTRVVGEGEHDGEHQSYSHR